MCGCFLKGLDIAKSLYLRAQSPIEHVGRVKKQRTFALQLWLPGAREVNDV